MPSFSVVAVHVVFISKMSFVLPS